MPTRKPLKCTIELADGSIQTLTLDCRTLESIETVCGRSIAAINDEMATYKNTPGNIRVGTMYNIVCGALRSRKPYTDEELAELVTPLVLMPAMNAMAPAWNEAVLQFLNLPAEDQDPKAPSAVGGPGASSSADSNPENSTPSTPPTSG